MPKRQREEYSCCEACGQEGNRYIFKNTKCIPQTLFDDGKTDYDTRQDSNCWVLCSNCHSMQVNELNPHTKALFDDSDDYDIDDIIFHVKLIVKNFMVSCPNGTNADFVNMFKQTKFMKRNHQTCGVPGCNSPSWASFHLAEPICTECYRTEHDATYDAT